MPWSGGLVVKKGLKMSSMMSGGIPLPLSLIRISTPFSERRVTSVSDGS